jgi:hypothetical protein
VLGLKAEMDMIFTHLPLVIRDPNMVSIFPLYLRRISIIDVPIFKQYDGSKMGYRANIDFW